MDRVREAKVVSTSSSTPILSVASVTGQLQPANYPDPYIYLHVITLHPRLADFLETNKLINFPRNLFMSTSRVVLVEKDALRNLMCNV